MKDSAVLIEQYHGDWWGGLPDGEGEHQKINGMFYLYLQVIFILEDLKMGLNMEMVFNIMLMGIFTKDSLSMDLQKDMVSILGEMEATIKEILNKDTEMDMEYGNQKEQNNNIKVIIYQIESMDMECMTGEIIQYIKANIQKTYEQVKDNYIEMDNQCIQVYGKMDKGLIMVMTIKAE